MLRSQRIILGSLNDVLASKYLLSLLKHNDDTLSDSSKVNYKSESYKLSVICSSLYKLYTMIYDRFPIATNMWLLSSMSL